MAGRHTRKPIASGLTALLAIALGFASSAPADPPPGQPNVVVIMTDDQTLADLETMPLTRQSIGDAGVTFSRFYVSFPLCCPSRATMLTGQYAHNHGVESNIPPRGGYPKLDKQNTLPVWLDAAGYRTIQVGKFLNGYGSADPTEIPPGWDEWYATIRDTNSVMWGYTLNENGRLRTYGDREVADPPLYQTDVLRQIAVDAIERDSGPTPFFLNLNFGAPHLEAGLAAAIRPAPRHDGALSSLPLPVSPAFNERDVSDKPSLVSDLPRFLQGSTDRIAARLRDRREALLSVDEAVQAVVEALDDRDELDRTYIFFTSDNGFYQGEHRLERGKNLPYEPAVHLPLLVRGPDIAAGVARDELVANVDLAPTIVAVAGAEAEVTVTMDGRSLLPFASDPLLKTRRPLLLENGDWPSGGTISGRATASSEAAPGAPYQGIRTDRYKYVEYRNKQRELYDLEADPDELSNVVSRRRYAIPLQRLRWQLSKLRQCAGDGCRAALAPVPKPKP